MTNIYELKNRLLVPNWRDFKRTIKLGELGEIHDSIHNNIENSQVKLDWENSKTIGIAADLINSSFISNDLFSRELVEAMDFVEANLKDASDPLMNLVQMIRLEINPQEVETSTKILEKNIDSVNEFQSIINDQLLNKMIAKTKNLTKSHLANSINWIELARLYTIRNQSEKAERCITIALNLAPNNRFVLRSAVRFFIHTNHEDKAIYYLKKSENIRNDPWLISAHIASSKLVGRYSPFIKIGEGVISSKKFSNFDLTELSSSLGTLELESGSFKKSKPLIDLSLKNPNDNSLAQFEWLSKKDNRLSFNANSFDEVKNPFEAFAYENFQKGKFLEAFYNCINWFLDVPYSKRPLVFGSYIACLVNDYDAAIVMCLAGLRLNNSEVGFINNIVYALCLKNELDEVPKYINQLGRINLSEYNDEDRISIQATLGLYLLRSKDIDEGKKMYKMAIENATKIKKDYYKNLAIINFTRELFLLKDQEFEFYRLLFNKIKTSEVDVIHFKNEVNTLITKKYIL
ncbi:hypothetical protein [Chryseobacterium aquaticum]|uniref:tetratricopeptide repeat protein n=1 Tax=Chryseobacterium aquaticum TaxID=452084 RepID=UPI002FC96788